MQEEANSKLKKVLIEHSLDIVPYNDWLTCGGGLPGFRASVHNVRQAGQYITLQLDVEVVVEADIIVVESFAGWGESAEEALVTAFSNFIYNSLHVFLNGFCGKIDDQVTVEEWKIGQQEWKVIIGNYGVRSFEDQPVPLPESLFEMIEQLLRQKGLEPGIHWLRVFCCNVGDGSLICECLLDNETWEYAQDQLQTLDWQKRESFYSVRNFLVMLPKEKNA
jgi:hypothetical protein